MNRELAAHISDDGRIQTIKDHLEKTAETAKAFAGCFGAGEDAYLCGLIHDIGKYSEAFQKRIYKESKKRVDHSGAGAVELKKRFGKDYKKALFYLIINEVILLSLVVYFMMNDVSSLALHKNLAIPLLGIFLVYTYIANRKWRVYQRMKNTQYRYWVEFPTLLLIIAFAVVDLFIL